MRHPRFCLALVLASASCIDPASPAQPLPATSKSAATRAGGITYLPTLGGTGSLARRIDDRGYIVGTSDTPGGDSRAVLWTPGGEIRDLGPVDGGAATALAVNGHR